MDANTKNIGQMQRQISELSKRGIPIAVQQTLTATARHAYMYGRRNITEDFEKRNAWTLRSNSWQRAEGLDVDKMVAVAGSSAKYMAEQEEGFVRKGKGDSGVWVPTPEAAGQTGKRTKPITRKYRKGKIRIRKKVRKKAASPKQQKFFKMINAIRGNGYMWGTLNSTKGMWHIEGSESGGRVHLTSVRLLYSANKKTITTKATEWHKPASMEAVRRNEADEYNKALRRQVSRLKRKHKTK